MQNVFSFFTVAKWSMVLLFSTLFLSGCGGSDGADAGKNDGIDVHSYARPDEAVVRHIDLDIKVDFEKKQISGRASLNIENPGKVDKLYLDARKLTIERVTIGEGEAESETAFSLGQDKPFLGQPLIIDIQSDTRRVNVDYSSDPSADALQWLTPAQTAGKKHPFLFTQSQAVLARTWVPCQDGPGVRITYNATVQVDPALMAVMSATNPVEKNDSGSYYFEMKQPIPSYLLALAVGDIEFRSLGPRSGVYAEPLVIADAAFEFADTEKMITAAEALYGPYRWDRYDIIVLPPSFPFGGMENPRLTFATPTILAGDRSLVSLVAHELAHSWSGNLVTNATWNDFWLNEGFTTYFENRIMEAVYGERYARMLARLDYQKAVDEVEGLSDHPEDTHLYLDLEGRDPDAGMTSIAYDKGALFLRMLEQTFGREKWDEFLRGYFDKFAFQSQTTGRFVAYLQKELLSKNPELAKKADIESWIYGPGLPENCPVPQSEEFERVEAQIKAWSEGSKAGELNTEQWTTHHWLHFLRNLPTPLSQQQMKDLDAAFRFTNSGNSEISCQWLLLSINNNYRATDARLDDFLSHVGRRKFLKPLYEALAQTPEGLAKARNIYKDARSGYHPVSYQTIDGILDWQQ